MSFDLDKKPLLGSEWSVEDRLSALEARLDALTETCNTKCSGKTDKTNKTELIVFSVTGVLLVSAFFALLGYLEHIKYQKQLNGFV